MTKSKTSKRARKAVPVLTLLIPFAALISVVNVAISMSTSNWLDSYERVPISNSSIMEEFLIKRTVSGLWYLCSFNLTEKQMIKEGIISVPSELMNCSSIEYFVKDRYTSDPNDSTNAIRFAVTKAGPLFVVASILLGFAVVAAIFGYQRHRRIALFISGIVFIVSGLMLLIGLVVYLSALQSEIGPKLRPKNTVDMPQFSYRYGFSFILVVVGFIATELTGILEIFYYIYWHQLDWSQKDRTVRDGNGNGSSSTFRCQSHHHNHLQDFNSTKSSSNSKVMQHHPSCTIFNDFIPSPPPPPNSAYHLNMPRDYTTLTSCSDEEGSILFPPPPPPTATSASSGANSMGRKDHRNTQV